MQFVEVLVADATYHGDGPLTYSSSTALQPGAIVHVPVRNRQVLGVVTGIVSKPAFAAKPILDAAPLPPLPNPLLETLEWMRGYYPAPLGITTQLFLPKALPKRPLEQGAALQTPSTNDLPPLTGDQQAALQSIEGAGFHVLHGETGSGKTRVYIELALRSFQVGRSSVILTPEIGLTSQLATSFRAVFGDRVVVMHSGLTDASRAQLWQWILEQTEPVIVVGARSALFSPVRNLGLIVVDEAHETAYKQDQAPYYHASTVAAKLAAAQAAAIVLGSATPLVSDYYIASAKQRPIIRMTEVATKTMISDSQVVVVDLKDRSQFTKSPHLSTPLVEAIRAALNDKEQVILFLNRRGTARVIFCERCGWQATCPHCDLPLIYHGDQHVARCHSCTYRAPVPKSCPECSSTDILFKSIGTKAITDEVSRLFPEAKVMRFDTDNKKNERLETHYDTVQAGNVDILVGTQTLAKGLDLPKLGLVGVVAADTGLYFPDFSAEERTYQLLSQVLGRVSRGHRDGRAIIQTYEPSSLLLEAILTKNWDSFYSKELAERSTFMFPPFCYLLKLTCRRSTSTSAQKAAEVFRANLDAQKYAVRIEGPAPAFREKAAGKFSWQLIVKSKNRGELTKIIRTLPSGWTHDIDPMNLL